MISGYYTALERTMFLKEIDAASLQIWNANIAAHEYGMSLLQPGMSCSTVTQKINAFLQERDLLQYRSFGYGHYAEAYRMARRFPFTDIRDLLPPPPPYRPFYVPGSDALI